MSPRHFAGALALGLAGLLPAATAHAAYTPQFGQLTIDRPTIPFGESVTATGTGFDPCAGVQVLLNGVVVEEGTAGSCSSSQGSAVVPAGPVSVDEDVLVLVAAVTPVGTADASGSYTTVLTPNRCGSNTIQFVGSSAGAGDAPLTLTGQVTAVCGSGTGSPGGGTGQGGTGQGGAAGALPFTGAGDIAALVALGLVLAVGGGVLRESAASRRATA